MTDPPPHLSLWGSPEQDPCPQPSLGGGPSLDTPCVDPLRDKSRGKLAIFAALASLAPQAD
eukprot:5957525-Prymnesium_polylepis.1